MDNYGALLNETNIKLHRKYFIEMCSLLGIQVFYRAPRENKHYNDYGELDTYYYEPVKIGCIFEDHPTQQTLKKLGWASELQEDASVIHVPYDLQNLQQGALFIIPSAFDNTKGRLFRVGKMSANMIYPASISCEIVPEYENTFNKEDIHNFKHTDFNLLNEEEEE